MSLPGSESRLILAFQLIGILALVISIFVLFAAADRLGHNRKHMALASELSQTLLELKQLSTVQPGDGSGYSDQFARLIGYGDVQIAELSSGAGSGFFASQATQLDFANATLAQAWRSVKSGFAGSSSLQNATGGSSTVQDAVLQQFAALRGSFDKVFAAIAKDTLSAELLAANSELLGTLKNVNFVLGIRDSVSAEVYNQLLQNSLSEMQTDVTVLVSMTTAGNGGVLLGYESRQLLAGFVSLSKSFNPALSVQADPDYQSGRQQRIVNALDSANNYQRLLEFASQQNRRAILFAVASLCVSLICLLLSLWRIWRNQTGSNAPVNQQLESLRSELCAIADGNLSVRASQQSGAIENSIAQAANHTVEMLVGLVRLFRRTANRLNELAVSQHTLAKRWIKSEIRRHEQMDQLSQAVESQLQAVEQLHQIEAAALADKQTPVEQVAKNARMITQQALTQLAKRVAECRDVLGAGSDLRGGTTRGTSDGGQAGEGLLKMRQRMHELSGTVSAVRLAAEQARLQVLNTSLQMTAYAGTADIDDQSRLVEDIQGISNQLASSAAGAERLSAALADDLQKYAENCDSNKADLISHFDQLQEALNECSNDSAQATGLDRVAADSDSDPREQVIIALTRIQREQQALLEVVVEMRSEAQSVSDGDPVELLEQVTEMQKMSLSLARAAESYGGTGND